MTTLCTASKAALLRDRRDDLYETPEVAVEALLAVESLPTTIWEPAYGPGAIARVLRAHGHVVYATDLVEYDSSNQDQSGWDFLLERQLPIGVEAIVTNPPFKLATEFAEHALYLCPRVVMLCRLAFLESGRRSSILDSGKLARVHVFKNGLPMMHRDGWQGPRATSATAFAWMRSYGNAAHCGAAELHRLAWERT